MEESNLLFKVAYRGFELVFSVPGGFAIATLMLLDKVRKITRKGREDDDDDSTDNS